MCCLGGQAKIDEFAFVLLAGLLLIVILMIAWGTPTEAEPLVEPTSISLSIPRNMSSTFDINITGKLTNVTLSASGEIKDWVSFNKNLFDVSDSTVVTIKFKVPNVTIGTYTGKIVVESLGGEKSISVSISVVELQLKEYSRSIPLGDFSVSFTEATETLDSKENLEVSAGYFSNYPKSLVGVLTEENLEIVTDGYIQLIIEETNSAGNLIVLFNNKEVFNKKVGVGEIIISIDKSQIEKSNSIVIKAGMPGWKFWMSTVYRLKTAKFVVNYEGAFSKDIQFSLSQDEIDNFDRFHLIYRTKNYSIPLQEMIIKINYQIVFSDTPPLTFFNKTFQKDILGNSLFLTDNNTISFLFEKQAFYEISNAILNVYYTSLE